MNKLCVAFLLTLVNAFSICAQIATYGSPDGHYVYMNVGPSCTVFQIDQNQPFTMVMNGVKEGWFMYSSPAGGIMVSGNMQQLAIITFNPPAKKIFKLINISSSGGTDYNSYNNGNSYHSGRSRSQIQADINHIERLMQDAKHSQSLDNSISGNIGYNGIIQKYEQMLRDLYQELNAASY